MKKSLLDKWCEALRSGEFKQTCSVLRNDEGHCCLGVLLEVYDASRWTKNENGDSYYDGKDLETLNPFLLDEVGLSSAEQDRCTEMNDDLEYSFDKIAEEIENTISITEDANEMLAS